MKTLRHIPTDRSGFSLAELMVVIVILGLLATVVVPNVLSYLGKANTTVVKNDISQISTAITNYMINNGGKAPPNLEVLQEKDENGHSYLVKIPNDPWKNPYIYEPPSAGQDFRVISYGKDGAPGGEGEDADMDNLTILERK
ncbi:MAG TPA: type II secretion system major pseudopilin GspG [Planctomycetota bacterium]|nr:type II secretion system major pseudopilin GspG [Planctomycetota bacterium]